MKLAVEHRWDLSPSEAIALQKDLAGRIETEDRLGPVRRVAGVDVGFEDRGRTTRAAIAVLECPSLELLEHRIARLPTSFPYVPGLLSFRECPAVLAALDALSSTPDLLLCDGQGIAHPRRLGIASHLGLITGLPAVGVAKSRLVGEHDAVPEAKGSWTELRHRGEVIGAVLRTREKCRPLFISSGHRIRLATAIDFTLACTTRYRLPETTRWADGLASGKPSFLARLDQDVETAS